VFIIRIDLLYMQFFMVYFSCISVSSLVRMLTEIHEKHQKRHQDLHYNVNLKSVHFADIHYIIVSQCMVTKTKVTSFVRAAVYAIAVL